jgi:hypothetical protein
MRHYSTLAVCFLVALVVCPASADEPPTVTAKAASAWEYPEADNMMSSTSGSLYNSGRTTTDDLARVVAYYEKKLGTKIALDKPKAASHTGGGGTKTAVFQDSLQPAENAKTPQARDVTLVLASQDTEAHSLTLVISRAKGEKHAHIVLTFVSKRG